MMKTCFCVDCGTKIPVGFVRCKKHEEEHFRKKEKSVKWEKMASYRVTKEQLNYIKKKSFELNISKSTLVRRALVNYMTLYPLDPHYWNKQNCPK